jgi:membrane fusion protein, heavy metal efflux system
MRFTLWVIVLGVVSVWLSTCQAGAGAQSETPPPTHIRENGVVTVPERSELRHYLVLGNARKQVIQAPLSAPAVVEADPSKVANILPPLSGRISALYVHLGDAVRSGQPLFTIDSSDLAQARSDLEKALAALTLTQKA